MDIKSYEDLLTDMRKYREDNFNNNIKSLVEDKLMDISFRNDLIQKAAAEFNEPVQKYIQSLPKCVIFNDTIYYYEEPEPDKSAPDCIDKLFLHEVDTMNNIMLPFAKILIRKIREWSPGTLKKEGTHRYVNTPNNFWGVINQTRERNLRINIYGKPVDHETTRFKLVLYDRVYSYFFINDYADLLEGIKLIKKAHELKKQQHYL